MRGHRPERTVTCECGKQFTTTSPRAFRCPTCRKTVNSKAVEERHRLERTKPRADKTKVKKTIAQVMAELAAYNREHGTCMSYGAYVQMTGG